MSANQPNTNAAHPAATGGKPKRERKPATPPTKLEAAVKISKLLKAFNHDERKTILELAAQG